MTDYGSDFSCVIDIDAGLSVVSGSLCVAQAVARRWLCPSGGLWYDRRYGYGIQRFLAMTDPPVQQIASGLASEARKDERVEDCSAEVTFTPADNTLTIDAVLVTAAGPFEFTLLVGSLTASMLIDGVTVTNA